MEMSDEHFTTAGLREVAVSLEAALSAAGRDAEAGELRAAVGTGDDPEGLLELRSAMIATRNVWEEVASAELRMRARHALAAAKRFAIGLG